MKMIRKKRPAVCAVLLAALLLAACQAPVSPASESSRAPQTAAQTDPAQTAPAVTQPETAPRPTQTAPAQTVPAATQPETAMRPTQTAPTQTVPETEPRKELEDMMKLQITINDQPVTVEWESNEAIRRMLSIAVARSSLWQVKMSMYGGFEQVGALGTDLPTNDAPIVTQPGDIVLYQGSQIVIFYGSNSWSYTRLGRITDKTPEELAALLGNGNVTLRITAVPR